MKSGISRSSFLALAAFLPAALSAAGWPTGVEKIDFRGWRDCYRVGNKADFSVVIVPQVGGRLAAVNFRGRNLLFRNPGLDGSDLSAGNSDFGREWLEWDGDQPDLMDEQGVHQHQKIWCSPYKLAGVDAWSVTLQSEPGAILPAMVTKTFVVDPERPALRFGYSVKNLDDKPHKWVLYHRIRLAPGLLAAPAPNQFEFSLYPERKRLEFAVRKECLRLTPDNLLGLLPQNMMLSQAAELSLNPPAGWLAHTSGGAVLAVRWPAPAGAEYRDGIALSVYWEGRFADMAPRSPIMDAAPGETVSFDTVWTCAPCGGPGADFLEISEIKAAVDAMAKENP